MATVSPLSNPKGVHLECELCGKPAHIQCKQCRVAYYCDKTHEILDSKGIHSRICHLLVPLRSKQNVIVSDEDKEHRDKQLLIRRAQILDICKAEAHKKLYVEQFDLAIPAALQALRFSMDIHGKDSVELVPSYLLLGEASIGLKQFNQAEDYLSMAKWAVMKSSDCDYEIRAQLCRNFGLLYASQKNFREALEQLSEDIYYLSLIYGPDDVHLAGGYFQVGRVFDAMDNEPVAKINFQKSVDIWKKEITELTSNTSNRTLASLDEACVAEGIQALTQISGFFQNKLADAVVLAEQEYLLSKLYEASGDLTHALSTIASAFTRIEEFPKTAGQRLAKEIRKQSTALQQKKKDQEGEQAAKTVAA